MPIMMTFIQSPIWSCGRRTIHTTPIWALALTDFCVHVCRKSSELTRRHRQKRILNQFAISLDADNGDEEDCKLLDFIPSDFDTFDEAVKRLENGQFHDNVQRYLSKLSNQQVNILNLLMDGYKPDEIRHILELSVKEYSDNLQTMRSYEYVKILF